MKTSKETRTNSSRPNRPVAALFLLVLLIGGCAARHPDHVVWHQHYRAIETNETDRFVAATLATAMAIYGPPLVPINAHHIRQSIGRRDYAGIRQADVTDWPLLAATILTYQDCLPALTASLAAHDGLLASLRASAAGQLPPFSQRQEIIALVNTLIRQGSIPRTALAPCRDQDPQPATSPQADQEAAGAVDPAQLLSPAIAPLPSRKRVRAGLELCELSDRERGVFILYVSVPAEDEAFYAQLSHETLHMLNPFLFDWYMEGLCNLFAEEMSVKFGFPWQTMARHLQARRHTDPYAIAYYMMKELKAVCGTELNTLLHFATWTDQAQTRMHLDIDAWLRSLPADKEQAARRTIDTFAAPLQKHQGRRNHFSPVAPAGSARRQNSPSFP